MLDIIYKMTFSSATPCQVDPSTTSAAFNNPELNTEIIQEYIKKITTSLSNPWIPVLGWIKFPQAERADFSATTQRALGALPADWPEVKFYSHRHRLDEKDPAI